MPFDSSQGVAFTFNGVVYTATSISVSKSKGEFNVTSLEIPVGTGKPRYRAGGLKSLELKVDWISGGIIPPTDNVYDIALAGAGAAANAGITGESLSGKKALCTGLSITAQAGDLIKGSATFKISVD
jgi:hypothetical protein